MPTYRNTAEAVSKLTPSSIARRRLMGPSVPFSNEYWDNRKSGLYIAVSSEPLFACFDKLDSETG
ncbi:peptide methionine sulfoxide reductase MsrB [Bradyrhizobium sp. JR4.1]|jgi:peptide methionine sulfoxide reductase msrA/msrB|nr:SelR domain [Bradyrhizobium sp. WSM1253]